MDLEAKLWEVTEKLNDYHVQNAEKMRRMIDEGPDSGEFDEFVDSDSIFLEEVQRELVAIVDEAREEERNRLRSAVAGSAN